MTLKKLNEKYTSKLSRLSYLNSIAIIIFLIAILTLFHYTSGISKLEKKISHDQKRYIELKKEQNREIVRSVIDIINTTVTQNSHLSKKEQQALTLDLLRDIRYGDDDSGYIFSMILLDIEGGKNFALENLVPVAPEKEGKYISDDYKDSKGREYRKEYLKQIRQNGEAHVQYTYIKNNEEENIEKLAYYIHYKPWNWLIGTGTYLDKLEAIQKENEKNFHEEFQESFINRTLIILFLGLISLFITTFFNKKIKRILKEQQEDLENNQKILEQYKEAVDVSSIFSKTDTKGVITYANDQFCKISGYSQEELIGKKHNIIRDPEVRDSVFKNLWETITSQKVWQERVSNQSKDGRRYYVDATIFPIVDRDGKIIEYISIRHDVTELEQYREVLENQLDLSYNKLVESFQLIREYEKAIDKATAFLRTDLNWKITSANDTLCNLVNINKKDFLGEDIAQFFKDENQDLKFDIHQLQEENSITKNTKLVNNNKTFYFHSIFVPILGLEGDIREILSIHHDITEIISLTQEIEDTQKEVVFTMGTIGESRSKETGNHVKRVAEYSYELALLAGLPQEEAEILKMASPMHDIGKVAIPDSILNKPGKLTDDEIKQMQTHSKIGFNLFKHSARKILQAASIVSHQHHEKFDGTGYPSKLQGEDIHIYGRITAIADVFDALGSDRVYKKAWDDERLFQLFKDEKGKHFDPHLVDLFLDNVDIFLEIRSRYKDVK